jgi:hypothetical protein
MNNKENRNIQSEFTIPASLNYQEVFKKAREYFYKLDPNIIGVNIGPRRVKNSVRLNEYALIVYVLQKQRSGELARVIPKEFMGLRTDVHAPMSIDAPKGSGDFVADRHISADLRAIDWVRVHVLADELELPDNPQKASVQDFGDICVVQDDGTVVKTRPNQTRYIDYVRAYQLFRTLHGDDYDFVTFFVDSDNGMPGVYSFYSPIFNDVQGIGFPPYDVRSGWGTSRLQGFLVMSQGSLGTLGSLGIWRYAMLQEFGHRFAAFARYKDPATGVTMSDHLLDGILGHWALNLDDDQSPMDYDPNDWVELSNGEFRDVFLNSEDRTYCNLDLYLMGLLGPDEVGEFTLLRDRVSIAGSTNFSATPVRLNIHNFIAQEGPRIPTVARAQKSWRQAFIVLTKDIYKVHDFVDRVDLMRLRWEQDFSQGTKGLGRVDTVLGSRTGRAADFTIIISSRQGFGSEPGYLDSIEAGVPFVGWTKDYTFSCPNVNSGEAAVLMFQSRAVNSSKNVMSINGINVFGGIPVSPNTDAWNGNVMLIGANVLRQSGNELHIESRNMNGGTDGNIDDFILDNVVVMYKTR